MSAAQGRALGLFRPRYHADGQDGTSETSASFATAVLLVASSDIRSLDLSVVGVVCCVCGLVCNPYGVNVRPCVMRVGGVVRVRVVCVLVCDGASCVVLCFVLCRLSFGLTTCVWGV